MKIFKTVVGSILLLTLTLVSCSKSDDDNSSSNNNSVVGAWTFEKTEALDADGKLVSETIEEAGKCGKFVIEFLANGNTIETSYDEVSGECVEDKDFTKWKIEGNQLMILPEDEDPDNTTFTFKRSGDVLELTRPLKRWEAGEYELNVTQLKFVYKKK